MVFLDVILRWLHIVPAVTLVGGALFMRFAYHPALVTLEADQRERYETSVYARWSKLVMFSVLLLLTSGMVNFMLTLKNSQFDNPGEYHGAFGLKFRKIL